MPGNRDLKLGFLTHDLEIRRRDLQIAESTDAIRQRLKIRLKFFFGEWFLDIQAGQPYYEQFLVKNPDLQRLEALLKVAISTVPRVLEITSFSMDYDNQVRRLFVSFSVSTQDGDVSFEGLAIP